MAEAYVPPTDLIDDGSDEPQGITIRDLLVAVRRRWWLAAAVAGLVLVVGYWHTMRQPRMYRAQATVRLQAGQAMLPGVNTMPTRLDYRIDPLLSEQAIIKSEQVAERVATMLGLRFSVDAPENVSREQVFGNTVPLLTEDDSALTEFALRFAPTTYSAIVRGREYTAVYGDSIRTGELILTVPRRPEIRSTTARIEVLPIRAAAGIVRGGLTTRAVPQTDLVEITYTGGEPPLVRDIANAVAHAYQQFSLEGIRTSATQKTEFIEQSLKEQERSLKAVQDSLKTFKEQHQTADITADAKALFASIDNFEQQRLAAQTQRETYAALLEKVSAADSVDDELRRLAASGVLEENKSLATKFDNWQKLVQQKQTMLLERSRLPNNPDVREIDNLIRAAKHDLQIGAQVYLNGLDRKLATLQQTIARLRAQSERFPPLEAQQARLMASVTTAQALYVDLRSQLQLARISESADGGTVRIIDDAQLPTFAVSPERRRAFFVYLLLGLCCGIAMALLVERLDDSVRSPLELSERYGTPVLGMIPAIAAQTPVGSQPGMSRLVTHVDPRSPVAEAYRSLRTNLAFARSQRNVRSLVLTSPGPSDGKSTTVTNLAITFAQQGQRVLLVDADLRRAVLDKTFGVPRSPGLTDVLIGEHTVAESSHETQVPNLYLMSSGQLPPNPSELLGSPAMRKVVGEMTAQFDMVLFDSPPLLAVTDAAVLSSIVDGTVLIARMGSTARKGLWRAIGQLRAVQANVLGGVLNDVSSDLGAYYGGYGQYYYYSYHPEGTNGNGQLPVGILGRLRRLTAGVTGGPKWG